MLARVRWGNVALAATIVGVAVLVAAWPALRAPAPPAPDPTPKPMATTLPARPTVTTPPPEFGVQHTTPIAKPRPVTPGRRPATRHRPASKPRRHRHRRPAPPVASPAPPSPPQPAPAPHPAPVPRRQHAPSSVTAEFGPPPEF